MALYKYVTIDILKRIINGSIRFAQPGAFNDPFEMLPELHVPKSFGNTNINIRFDILSPRREPKIYELEDNFESDYCNDIISRKILASLNESIGILCLSRNPASLVMWSHYANEYAGAVIEFNDEHEFFKGKIEIVYRDQRPKKDISHYISNDQPIPIAELCVKSTQWEYESEVRIIRNLSDCKKNSNGEKFSIYIMEMPQVCIKSVIIGERTPVEEQREIWHLLKDTRISLSLAAISNRGYEFRNETIKNDEPISVSNPMISPRTAHVFSDHSGELGEIARWMIKNHHLSEAVNDTV
jgi:hypothetical protein